MDRPTMIAKLAAEVVLVAASGLTSLLAAVEGDTLVAPTAVVAFIGFTGLLVRQVTGNQKVYVDILAGKDAELAALRKAYAQDVADRDDQVHYLRWEVETLRYRHGERLVDPGPFVPRVRPPAPPTTGAQP